MSQQWYSKKWVNVGLHVSCWVLFFTFPLLLRPAIDHEAKHTNVFTSRFYYIFLVGNILRVILFYSNAYIFIPRLVYRRKLVQYALVLLLAIVLLLSFDKLFFLLFIPGWKYVVWNFFVFNLPVFVFIVIASTAFRLIRDRIQENQRNKERETENLKTELSFLRSQVSPHFMFNVLNNMVSLARKKSDALEPSLIKLSQLLRYMLYETDEDRVMLEKEVEYLQSYIELQKQRFGKNVQIHTCFQNTESGYTIEPMLLIPFVENAFKHGTGFVSVTKAEGSDLVLYNMSEIHISLRAENGILNFSVQNRYNETAPETKDKTSGIGLSNVQRRLNLLYHNNHSLAIEKKEGWFIVNLQLNLH